jgi:hypothetical protein
VKVAAGEVGLEAAVAVGCAAARSADAVEKCMETTAAGAVASLIAATSAGVAGTLGEAAE